MSKSQHRLTDRAALLRNRARARRAPESFLHDVAIDEVRDRISMVNKSFHAPALVAGLPELWQSAFPDARLVGDNEVLDLAPAAHDLVIHAMCLHWADDPVGQLIQSLRSLKPDGLFLAVFPAGQTLTELRAALGQAEIEVHGGLSPRVLPMAEIRDLGALLQRAGFALPVADSLPLTASYQSLRHLARDLRAMGEGNAIAQRRRTSLGRRLLDRAEIIYAEAFPDPDNTDRIRATFDLVTLTGWAPDASQQQPLRPGSATSRLADALGAKETPLDD